MLLAAVLFLIAEPAVWAQASGNNQLGIMNRLRDAARLRTDSLASVKLTFSDGTLTSSMDKYTPKVLFVHAKLDGKAVKLARGAKAKKVKELSPGELLISVERPLHSTRHRTSCVGYLFEGEQEVLIYPVGEGIECKFVIVREASEEVPDWEQSLTFEQFEAAGRCLDAHEEDSPGFNKCLEKEGVPLPPGE